MMMLDMQTAMFLMEKIMADTEEVCEIKPRRKKMPKAESRRSMTRKKAQSRMRLEKQLPDDRVPVNPADRNYQMSHYGRFANHARIKNYIDRDWTWAMNCNQVIVKKKLNAALGRPRKKDFRKDMELALEECV